MADPVFPPMINGRNDMISDVLADHGRQPRRLPPPADAARLETTDEPALTGTRPQVYRPVLQNRRPL